ncbi:MAG TPA: nucleotidyltransferase domain-containing protein [Candidatus Nitrosotenuis sp.]
MKLHKYLEGVLGNKGAISVLRALVNHRGRTYTIRRLAKDAGISHTETSATIQDLEKLGIVQVQPIGKAYNISLNEKSYVLANIIEPVLDVEKKSLDQVISICKKHLSSKKIISAVIFGSVARGEEKEDSDIDLLIISNDFDKAIEIVSRLSEEMSLAFHTRISHITFSEKKLRSKRNSDLIRSIIKEHILVSGKELEDLIK